MSASETNRLAQTAVHLLSNHYQARSQIAQFRQQMVLSFNEGELRDLCFDLHLNYDSLPGSGTSDKAREIIALCLRQRRADELLAYCRQARPTVFDNLQLAQADTAVAETADAETLHQRLTKAVQADAYAGQTLARLAEQPGLATRQNALAALLTELMRTDAAVGQAVRQALGETAVGDQISQQVTLSGDAQAGDINLIGKVEGNMPEGTFNKEKKKKR